MSHYSCKQYLQLRQIEVGKSPILEMCFYPLYKLFSQQRYQSISNRLANGVSILDVWQKRLKHLQQFGKRLGKFWQFGKIPPSPRIYGNLGKGLANPLPACMLRMTTKIKSSPCLHAVYCLFFILLSPKQQTIGDRTGFYLANSFESW